MDVLKQGYEATQRNDWTAAIEHFSKAQGKLNAYPPVLLNLALAHEKAGHELAAMAWYAAYAAAAPGEPNITAVRKQIRALDISTTVRSQGLLSTTVNLAAQYANLPKAPDIATFFFHDLAMAYAEAGGDMEIARRTAKLYPLGGTPDPPILTDLKTEDLKRRRAGVRARSGDIAIAEQLLSEINASLDEKNDFWQIRILEQMVLFKDHRPARCIQLRMANVYSGQLKMPVRDTPTFTHELRELIRESVTSATAMCRNQSIVESYVDLARGISDDKRDLAMRLPQREFKVGESLSELLFLITSYESARQYYRGFIVSMQ